MSRKNEDTKSIIVKVSFFAKNNEPKHAWTSGQYLTKNNIHGIQNSGKMFNSLSQIPLLIEELLVEQRISLEIKNSSVNSIKRK